MTELYGREVKKDCIRRLVGNMDQLADMRLMSFEEGKARGMRSIECKNGAGMEFTILPDRCMDIAWAQFQGIPFSYISKSEVCAPQYFVENGDKGFLDNFYAGLLTTSGLSNTGAANQDQGKEYGLHGTISNLPASQVKISKAWRGEDYVLKAQGQVRQSRFYGEDFLMTRTIEMKLGDNRILIADEFENCGFEEQPFMILYHMNFGYPFLSGNSRLVMNKSQIRPRTAEAQKGLKDYDVLMEPVHGYREQCFYHDFETALDGMVYVGLYNPTLGSKGMTVYLKYAKEELPCFCQWKQLGEQEYVMGLIPSNGYAEGRCAAREHGELTFLKPGEKKKITLEVGIEEGKRE